MPALRERDIIDFPLTDISELRHLFEQNLKNKGNWNREPVSTRSDERIAKEKELLTTSPTGTRQDTSDRILLAWLYEIEGRFNDAIDLLEKVLSAGVSNYYSEIYVQLVSLYERQGDYEKAYKTYRKVIKSRPIILLRKLPVRYSRFDEFIVCGRSTNQNCLEGFDLEHPASEHLNSPGVIRLGFLSRVREEDLKNRQRRGRITEKEHIHLLTALSEYLKVPLWT